MRYAFYQHFGTEGHESVFKLFIQQENNDFVDCYMFTSNLEGISNKPGVTRLFGKQVFDIAGNYFLFPISYDHVDTGNFSLLEKDDKFIRLFFEENDDNILSGEWILRRLSNGSTLFWKPFPVVFNVPTKNVDMQIVEELKEVEQKFSMFEITAVNGNEFEGTLAAEGIWTGQDLHTTLFSDKIIETIYQKFSEDLPNMVVDYNHDMSSSGHFTDVSLHEKNGIKYIDVKGVGDKPIPLGSSLSLHTKSKIIWDKNLNVHVLLDAAPVGGSILTEGKSACTICMIR